jgi:hypothetical protein
MPMSARASAGGIVDPVTDHGHGQAAGPQISDRAVLVGRQHLGEHLVHAGLEAEVRGDGLGDRSGVPGDHHNLSDTLLLTGAG